MFQLETTLAGDLLNREDEIFELLDELYPGRRYMLLSIQDAQHGKTVLLSKSKEVRDRLRETNLVFEAQTSDSMLEINHITMRKSVLKAVLER